MKGYLYAGIAIALLIVGALAVFGIEHWGTGRYNAGVDAGRDQVIAGNAAALAQYRDGQDALQAYAAAAGQKLNQSLASALPTIQGNTHATVETIRTVYVQTPAAPGSCGRPAGVQQALDDAVDRANAAVVAAGDLRSNAPAISSTSNSPAGDGGGHARQ